MVAAWSDLRGHYLPTLLGTMRVANPVVPIPILWLTTTPVGNDSASPAAPPRQYNQLPDLKFSLQPGNRVSSRIINRSIELILEAALRFQDTPLSLHLIIVAASPPLEGLCGVASTLSTQAGKSEWQLLSERMAQNKIHCHMILRSAQNMRSLEELFLANLQLQNHERVTPWFPASPDYSFYLSSSLGQRPRQTSVSISVPEPPVNKNQPNPSRPGVHRHQSFPLESTRSSPNVTTPGPAPSLVSSLQKIHGLSRKKLYGTQTAKQPFVREEPVRAKYRQAPTPLSIPANAEDRHGLSKSRIRSPERSSQSSSPSDSISPGRRSPRNHRGMSSPDMASIPALPPSVPPIQEAVTPVTSMHPESLGYTTVPVSSFSTPLMMPPTPTQVIYSGSEFTLTTPSAYVPPQQSIASSAGLPAWNTTPKYRDAGDTPFIFSPELEAATAAKLKAALQISPVTQPSTFTSGNSYMVDGMSYGPFVPPQSQQVAAPMQSYSACSVQPVAGGSNGNLPILSSATSSSLQGWAG